ncbi:MAG TPA: DUF4118 domain-containing protein, partial [Dehalococcoidales bacterium]|nr:DUF4118 domain-containing protein [Dehalococcoidales bacterium]
MTEKESRPNPDELLARVTADEERRKHGKLKIFLGYAAGVGKTYSMLESARQRMKELDVVIALVETHGRTETEALLQGFEIIPRTTIPYRGVNLTELDVDAVLRRKPQLVLIDELAHTNAPDSRHPKRYQDVEEIIDAGIDVYTTLNVQHIESLQDVVAQITGIWIRETVPDSIIDRASEIELVDLPPEELIKRLKEGKVYVQDQVARAIDEFFRKGNLTALRELSMRKAAERVDEQVRVYMGEHAIKGPWPTSEKILVCIGSGPEAGSLVRAGRRLATQLGSEWIAVHVETPFDLRLAPDTQERLSNYLRLAERMGAKVVSIQGNSVAVAVADYAVKNHITKIVVAKSRRRITRGFRPSISDRLLQLSDSYDVQVIAGPQEKSAMKSSNVRRPSVNYLKYLGSFRIIGLATLLSWLLQSSLDPPVLVTIFLIGVIISAVYLGLGPSIIASVLSVLIF